MLRRVILSGLLLSALVLSLGADAPGASSGGPSSPSAGRGGYTDPTFGFTITPPKLANSNERCLSVVFEGPPKNAFAPNVGVLVDPVRTTRKEYLDTSTTVLNQNGVKTISKTELTVGGYDAEMLDYEATLNTRRLHFLQLMVVTEENVYVVTCTSLADAFAAHQEQFQKCLQSFRPPGAK
jgi:hypothetical protein